MFCNGIADYRRQDIEPAGWECVFPLMGSSSYALVKENISVGIKTKLITIDSSQCSAEYCGRWFDLSLLAALPKSVDPCGENGEFHTFVVDAPFFQRSLGITWKNIDITERFYYQRYQLANRTVCES